MPKNPGPTMTSVFVSRDSRGGTITKTVEDNPVDTELPPQTFGLVEMSLVQEHLNEKTKTIVTQTFPQVVGKVFLPEWGVIGTLTKQTVAAGTVLTPEFSVFQGRIEPVDELHSEKELVSVDTYGTKVSYEPYNGTLYRKITESEVPKATIPVLTGFELESETIGRTDLRSTQRKVSLVNSSNEEVLVSNYELDVVIDMDEETGVYIYETHKDVPLTFTEADLPEQGDVWRELGTDDGYVHKAQLIHEVGKATKKLIVTWSVKPPTKVLYPSINYPFPGTLVINSGTWPSDGRPVPGLHYSYIPPRVLERQTRTTIKYNVGPFSTDVPEAFKVTAYMGMSITFSTFGGNLVHDAWSVYEGVDPVELIPASDPPASGAGAYTGASVIIASAKDSIWRGNIYRRIVVEVSADTDPSGFGLNPYD